MPALLNGMGMPFLRRVNDRLWPFCPAAARAQSNSLKMFIADGCAPSDIA
jgi:hypothetical protein